jgi:hypothetical protein
MLLTQYYHCESKNSISTRIYLNPTSLRVGFISRDCASISVACSLKLFLAVEPRGTRSGLYKGIEAPDIEFKMLAFMPRPRDYTVSIFISIFGTIERVGART